MQKSKVDRKEFLELVEVLMLAAGRNKEVFIVFQNNKAIAISELFTIHKTIEQDIEGIFPAMEIKNILSNLKNETIEVFSDKGLLKIQTPTVKAKIKTIKEIEEFESEIKNREQLEQEEFSKLPKNFSSGLKFCIFAANKDKSDVATNGVLCTGDKIIATNEMMLSQYELDKKLKDKFFIVLSNAIDISKRNVIKFYQDSTWTNFIDDKNFYFSTRRIDESKLLDIAESDVFDTKGEEIKFPEKLIKMIDTSSVLADGDIDFEKEIKINIEGKKIFCSGQNELGEITVKGKMQKNKSKTTIIINPFFLKEILTQFKIFKATVNSEVVIFEADNFKTAIAQWKK
jgi:hypothetical protein